MRLPKPASKTATVRLGLPFLLIALLVVLFFRSFLPGQVHFNNDGPLGQQVSAANQLPGVLTGAWADLNSIGSNGGGYPPSVSAVIRILFGPVGVAKFLAPTTLLILGLSAWIFFRQLKLSPMAAALGSLAAMFNSTFFSSACWGVATQEIAVGMVFLAMASVVSIKPGMPLLQRLARLSLAGLAVGMNVMEAADIGALFSLLVASFVVYHAWVTAEGKPAIRIARGIGGVTLVAVWAGLIAASSLAGLIETQIKGVAGMQQDAETRSRRWTEATQWSFPKVETLGLFMPGLFGYRMVPVQPDGSDYWGAIGRDSAWDEYFANGRQGPAPNPEFQQLRQSGGGNYAGVLVVLVALWTVCQSARPRDSAFGESDRRLIWFFAAVAVVSVLVAFGRHAPFYQLAYALPYSSTIRSPTKFLQLFSLAVVVLFACGVQGLSRRPVAISPANAAARKMKAAGASPRADRFDRWWIMGCLAVIALTVIGWMKYAASHKELLNHLEAVQPFGGSDAADVASFSIRQVGWFVLFLTLSVGVMILILRGTLGGARSKWVGIALGGVLLADLVRADLPWIVFWNYPHKYETYGPNPIIRMLSNKPCEHRVQLLPGLVLENFFQLPDPVRQIEGRLNRLYAIEWNQHLFPYYNIQTLDIIQRPRMPMDLLAFEQALSVRSPDKLRNLGRYWELTNTRYVLGFVGFLELLNTHMDPGQGRFRIAERFHLAGKPGIDRPALWEDLTAEPSTNGDYAVFEFTGALPRAKLYSSWQRPADDQAAVEALSRAPMSDAERAFLNQVGTNDLLTLLNLVSPQFDPGKTVLMASPVPSPAMSPGTTADAGTVEFASYAPKRIELLAQATAPAVLLLNDRFDPGWQVWVDGNREELLRCNFIMRGVYLAPGSHKVDFVFRPPLAPLYVSLAAIGLAVPLAGMIWFGKRRLART